MAATLARALDASGDASVRFFHCGDRNANHPFYGVRRAGSRHLNAVLARCGGSMAVQDMGVAQEIARHSRQADVIHLHNLHGYYLDWDRLLRGIGDRPLVWTWHDMWGATGRCGSALGCEGWKHGCDPCPHLNYYPAAWFDHAATEYQKKTEWWKKLPHLFVAAPLEWLRQIAIARGFAPDRVVCVPNPVDLSNYRPIPAREARERLGLRADGRYLLFVAADCNNPVKGYSDFLDIVRQVGWDGVVAGRAPSHIPAGVKHLGYFRDPRELSVCYSAADAVVVPSKTDNSPNIVIESMACGTPVFGFAVGGIPMQMHPRWGGVVEPRDNGALAKLLVRQLPNGGKPDDAVTEVRAFAASRWDAEKVSKEYLALYHRALASSQASPGAAS